MANNQRHDPIRATYYRPVEIGEAFGEWLFWITTGLSATLILVDRATHAQLYDRLQMGLVIAAVLAFIIGTAVRLYLQPRALAARSADLISQSFGVALSHETTVGYYNNQMPAGHRRLAAMALENAFFSKEISKSMLRFERFRAGVALLIFIFLMREDDLAFGAIAAATVFGEQVIVRYLRLEWFRSRCESIYKQLHDLFLHNPTDPTFTAETIGGLNSYESGKAMAGVTLSDRIFKKRNADLSTQWDVIKQTLRL
ncbi:hypothetical protein CFB46_33940 [Burkholderia sp. HI2761]|uniref:DUF4149 domain-containing protein n=1 Tax=Burkholderia TaxID=32008 RepID=UPI0004872F98|nr:MULTISPECIES: DUF4149 domain-containing protein [Burkholderia]MPV54911.1 hypothetical protein [Burkholderia sp. BE24]OXJ21850.1 hypothetical protein CFB46_33940 [Burkholderia sp. HI2761]